MNEDRPYAVTANKAPLVIAYPGKEMPETQKTAVCEFK